MKKLDYKELFKKKEIGNIAALLVFAAVIYMLISLYFFNHFFFNTIINGVDVSLKLHEKGADLFRNYAKNYELEIIGRHGETEKIKGQDVEMQYNEKNSIFKVYNLQYPLKWGISLFKKNTYYVDDLFTFNKEYLRNTINELNCLNIDVIEPRNVQFKYSNGTYEVIPEVYGNKINRENLGQAIKLSILKGRTKLDLDLNFCYENPKYTLNSDKTPKTIGLLNKYVSAKITYIFGSRSEILDGNTINKWLKVDENLDVIIDEEYVRRYVRELGKKYDTVGVARKFKTSIGKTVIVEGGFYGWKINCAAETIALIENIKCGEKLQKEPIYIQRALYREEDDIGNTYVEINITRQRLWFYKDGKLIAQGAVVTGNPNKGNGTKLGVYMLNYKEQGSTLRGPDYEAEVTYWMPFNGNIGIHDASWRHSFGGDIYKRHGTHGCVNVPKYLAKRIFENIEEGTPVICYEE